MGLAQQTFNPMESSSKQQFPSGRSPVPPPGEHLVPEPSSQGVAMFQRIGWRRASAGERRLWLIQGAIILGVVLLIGGLMLWILR